MVEMADFVRAGAAAALCVAGSTCAFDTIGKPLPPAGQARQQIFDDMFTERVERLLGEPLRPLAIFGKLTLAQLDRRIQVLEVIRFDAELAARRLKELPLKDRMKSLYAIAEGVKTLFNIDELELETAFRNRAQTRKTAFEKEKRFLMDPTTAILTDKTPLTTSTIIPKVKSFLETTTGKATVGIGAVALIWVLTRGD